MVDRVRDATRLEQMLGDASIELSSVASPLNTVSARAMLAARSTAGLIHCGWRSWRGADAAQGPGPGAGVDEHLRRPSRLVGPLDVGSAGSGRAALAEVDAVIVEACQPWQHQIELLQTIPGGRGDGDLK